MLQVEIKRADTQALTNYLYFLRFKAWKYRHVLLIFEVIKQTTNNRTHEQAN